VRRFQFLSFRSENRHLGPEARSGLKYPFRILESSIYNCFFKAEKMGVVIEICTKYPRGPLERRKTGTGVDNMYVLYVLDPRSTNLLQSPYFPLPDVGSAAPSDFTARP
jgi:hypothetical protein